MFQIFLPQFSQPPQNQHNPHKQHQQPRKYIIIPLIIPIIRIPLLASSYLVFVTGTPSQLVGLEPILTYISRRSHFLTLNDINLFHLSFFFYFWGRSRLKHMRFLNSYLLVVLFVQGGRRTPAPSIERILRVAYFSLVKARIVHKLLHLD